MAAGNTYTQIASTTLGSTTGTVTFSSIPSTYTDLIIVYNGQVDGSVGIVTQINGDTGTNYSSTFLRGDGSSASSGRTTSQSFINWANNMYGSGASVWATQIFQFMNYSNTTTNKTAISRASNAANQLGATVGLWRSTAAINQISLYTAGNNFLTGSTFNLYGIAAA